MIKCLPLGTGKIERRTHDYKHYGTIDLYAAFNTATGKVISQLSARHRAQDFLRFLCKIDRETPKASELHLILDNSRSHKTIDVQQWLEQHKRFKFHSTPTSA